VKLSGVAPLNLFARQLATLQAALIVTGGKLSEQRIISFGAGSAGLGIARQLRDAAVLLDGVSEEEANKLIFLVDKHGLLKQGISDKIRDGIDKGFVRQDRDEKDIGEWPEGENDLLEVIKRVKPTVLIGTSTVAGAFNEEIIKAMAEGTDRPIILPVSIAFPPGLRSSRAIMIQDPACSFPIQHRSAKLIPKTS
jgi:malate dehydrogenase (oxaloacetate-decarboxylating)